MKKKKFKMTRRQVLKAGLAGGAGLLLPWKFKLPKAHAAILADGLSDPVHGHLVVFFPRKQFQCCFEYHLSAHAIMFLQTRFRLLDTAGHALRIGLAGNTHFTCSLNMTMSEDRVHSDVCVSGPTSISAGSLTWSLTDASGPTNASQRRKVP